MSLVLDEIDIRICQILQEDGRLTNVELGKRVGLSAAPCLRRVRALEAAGVIRKYVALLDPAKVQLGVTVFVRVSLDLQAESRLKLFERAILLNPQVLECSLVAGDADYLLRVTVDSVASYEQFLSASLSRIESVAGINSSFSLRQVVYSTALPVARRLVEPASSFDRETR